jgi:hypothetical protein
MDRQVAALDAAVLCPATVSHFGVTIDVLRSALIRTSFGGGNSGVASIRLPVTALLEGPAFVVTAGLLNLMR